MTDIARADNVITSLVRMLEDARSARELMRKEAAPSAKFVTVKKFCALTGYTDSAVRGKISGGIWVDGREIIYAPDKHVMINMEAYDKWVRGLNRAVNQ